MQGFFITGTDTDVGKTIVSAWLVSQLDGVYYKPVQSGIDEGMSDLDTVLGLTQSTHEFPQSDVMLGAPLSPHEAARREGVRIDLHQFQLPMSVRPLIVEGAGGVLVPLNEKDLMIDLIDQFQLPVIVVARTGLGTINHTLLSLFALRARGIPIAGVIMNGVENIENRRAIETYGQVRVLAQLPQFATLDRETLLATPPDIRPEDWNKF